MNDIWDNFKKEIVILRSKIMGVRLPNLNYSVFSVSNDHSWDSGAMNGQPFFRGVNERGIRLSRTSCLQPRPLITAEQFIRSNSLANDGEQAAQIRLIEPLFNGERSVRLGLNCKNHFFLTAILMRMKISQYETQKIEIPDELRQNYFKAIMEHNKSKSLETSQGPDYVHGYLEGQFDLWEKPHGERIKDGECDTGSLSSAVSSDDEEMISISSVPDKDTGDTGGKDRSKQQPSTPPRADVKPQSQALRGNKLVPDANGKGDDILHSDGSGPLKDVEVPDDGDLDRVSGDEADDVTPNTLGRSDASVPKSSTPTRKGNPPISPLVSPIAVSGAGGKGVPIPMSTFNSVDRSLSPVPEMTPEEALQRLVHVRVQTQRRASLDYGAAYPMVEMRRTQGAAIATLGHKMYPIGSQTKADVRRSGSSQTMRSLRFLVVVEAYATAYVQKSGQGVSKPILAIVNTTNSKLFFRQLDVLLSDVIKERWDNIEGFIDKALETAKKDCKIKANPGNRRRLYERLKIKSSTDLYTFLHHYFLTPKIKYKKKANALFDQLKKDITGEITKEMTLGDIQQRLNSRFPDLNTYFTAIYQKNRVSENKFRLEATLYEQSCQQVEGKMKQTAHRIHHLVMLMDETGFPIVLKIPFTDTIFCIEMCLSEAVVYFKTRTYKKGKEPYVKTSPFAIVATVGGLVSDNHLYHKDLMKELRTFASKPIATLTIGDELCSTFNYPKDESIRSGWANASMNTSMRGNLEDREFLKRLGITDVDTSYQELDTLCVSFVEHKSRKRGSRRIKRNQPQVRRENTAVRETVIAISDL